MKTRPWPLVIVAALHVFGPFANVLISSILVATDPISFVLTLSRQETWLQLVTFFALMPLAGVAIYAVRAWSYPVFVSIMAWVLYVNYGTWQAYPSVFSFGITVATVLINIGVVSYLLLPPVRAAYFDKRLRWWETKPRFNLGILATLATPTGEKKIRVANLSEGGAFIEQVKGLEVGAAVTLSFDLLGRHYDAKATVVHSRAAGYGLQFVENRKTRSQMRRLAHGLAIIAAEDPSRAPGSEERLTGWFIHVLMTGEGWVPDLTTRPVPKEKPKAERKPERKPGHDDSDSSDQAA